ncbi:MAG: penicillin-binding protein 1C [Flavobacteriales bacterium]|nr:penicillin-binding protein 1C [Flavobacteriales bacterium]
MIRRWISGTWRWMKRYKYLLSAIVLILSVWYYNCLPAELFSDPTSTVLYDKNGDILGARIAEDGQWRFPHNPEVPERFAKSIVQFEDRTFYSHWGVSPSAIARAVKQNFSAGKVVSGGSTITMQVVRLMRKGKGRTFYEKSVEMILATRMEWSYSKNEILALYASNAPMGGNVVGLDAAAWRYYGRTPNELSWAESATLAVLPNAPSHIFPGKNQAKLKAKRDRVLNRLFEIGEIDSTTLITSLAEPLPQSPPDLPQLAPHLMDRLISSGYKGQRIYTTIDGKLQEQITKILEQHHQRLMDDEIYNAACLVVDVTTGDVVAYIGNVENDDPEHGSDVDIIPAPRSSGSILKPLLYAGMLNDGLITPTMLFPDVPTHISGYSPKNYNQRYDGAVPANRALSRSLNVPAVRMLQQFGIPKFHYLLKKLGMQTLYFPSSHYGLSLVLGGAETSLWDLAHIYAMMARTLNEYPEFKKDLNARPHFFHSEKFNQLQAEFQVEEPILNPASVYFTFQAMIEVARPEDEAQWQNFSNARRIAWKTGTSFGFRDAWAVGVNPKYVVAVWAGNADGEGRPGLVGVQAAAPILFDVFSRLPNAGWFRVPYDDMQKTAICRLSGHRASPLCSPIDTTWIPLSSLNTTVCPYHQILHLDPQKKFRVTSDCMDPSEMVNESRFVLPPVMEYYYKSRNPTYKEIPPFRTDCMEQSEELQMEILYPKKPSKIFIPVGIDGSIGKTVFEVTHRDPNAEIYWHLDEDFLGTTSGIHQMELSPALGKHQLTLIDNNGKRISQTFEVIGK